MSALENESASAQPPGMTRSFDVTVRIDVMPGGNGTSYLIAGKEIGIIGSQIHPLACIAMLNDACSAILKTNMGNLMGRPEATGDPTDQGPGVEAAS